MKPASFDYARCDTVDDALELLAEHGDEARVMAGGQSLMAMLNMRLVRPAILVDIAELDELRYVKEGSGFVEFGASDHASRSRSLAQSAPAVAAARGGDSAYRPFPDPQPRDRLRLALPRRSKLRTAALPRDAGR